MDRFRESNYIPAVFCAATRSSIAAAGGWPTDVPSAADWHLWKRILALPGSSVGFSRDASAVHFRARRRDSDHPAVADILRLTGRKNWWPAGAILDEGGFATWQESVAAIATNEWWTRLSEAAGTIVDHIALEAADLAGQLANAQSEIAALRSSRSWRITRPLRAMHSRDSQDTG
jgi:hypothetical protein